MKEIVIQAEKLRKVYPLPAEDVVAVNDVDLEVRAGEFVALMGPSGSGKTTLLDLLGCLDTISSGRLSVLGNDVSQASERDLVAMRRGDIGFVFQDFLLIPTLSALENVELPLQFARLHGQRDRARALLEQLGLGHRLHHLPRAMSGGERQRVAVARALVTSPKILFADEPTGNLDTRTSGEIYELFAQLNSEQGLTIVVATHDDKLGARAPRVVWLRDGAVQR